MSYFLISCALIIAVVDWFAVAKNWKKLEYFAKPGVIILLIVWLLINDGYQSPTIYFLSGLLFSLVGDIFLMMPDEKFTAGLVSFLLAHLAYIRGFTIFGINLSSGLILISAVIGSLGFVILKKLLNSLNLQNQGNLRLPIIVYAIIICFMLISAFSTMITPIINWKLIPAITVSVGAILFFISDTTLAWNRFINSLPLGRLIVIISYHLAQITITLGAGINFLT